MSYCCKGGKAAVLAPTRRYATAPGATTSTAHVFLDTLVCNVDPRARLLQMPDPLPLPVGGQSGHGSGGAAGAGGAAIAASATVCGDGVQRHVAWKREAGDATLPCEHLQGGDGDGRWPHASELAREVGRPGVRCLVERELQVQACTCCEPDKAFRGAWPAGRTAETAGWCEPCAPCQLPHTLPFPRNPRHPITCWDLPNQRHTRSSRLHCPPRPAELQRLAEAALPFIERVAARRAGGAPARARTLAFCGAGATVAYSMIGPGSHFCENIGRAHTSNHVFFVADLVKGAYAQKCHGKQDLSWQRGM